MAFGAIDAIGVITLRRKRRLQANTRFWTKADSTGAREIRNLAKRSAR
jgi:hypothetical protein